MIILGLFFTRGVSLQQWITAGLFDREILIYKFHLECSQLHEVIFFTYGADDAKLADNLYAENRLPKKIKVVPMPKYFLYLGKFASFVYTFLIPVINHKQLAYCTILKTNQMDGSLSAVIAAKILKKPLYVRTGYTLSIFTDRIHKYNILRRFYASMLERISFYCADCVSVSSQSDFKFIDMLYGPLKAKIYVISNYIDVARFKPINCTKIQNRILFVGRVSYQKNLKSAIEACLDINIGIDIIGDGPDFIKLKEFAETIGADVRWLGIVDNDNLPQILSKYQFFLLPSLWEGMPKALLEAMSMGLVCIGSNVIGINEVISDAVTGYLCYGTDAHQIADGLKRAMYGDYLSISRNAHNYIYENFSIEAIAKKENELFKTLISYPESFK